MCVRINEHKVECRPEAPLSARPACERLFT
jgi:hypothetical protein